MLNLLRFFCFFCCVFSLACNQHEATHATSVASSAVAVSPAVSSPSALDTPETRKIAAQQYLKIVPVSALVDDMTEKVSAHMKPEVAANFRKVMHDMDVTALQQTMLESMVKRFTRKEIEMLAALYSTPEGKSVMKKMDDYMADVIPAIQQHLYQAIAKAQQANPAG